MDGLAVLHRGGDGGGGGRLESTPPTAAKKGTRPESAEEDTPVGVDGKGRGVVGLRGKKGGGGFG